MMTKFKIRFAIERPAWTAALTFSIFGLLLAGCLSKPALKRQTFAFENPPPAASSSSGGIVAVNAVTVSDLFNGQSFVYRIGPEAYETDSYAGFLVPPNRAIAIAMRAHLLNSGRFADVIEPGSQRKADRTVEVYVSELYGDFTKAGQSAAVLSMRVSVADTAASASPSPLQKNYSRRIAIKENTATAVMAGWNAALSEIMNEVAAQVSTGR